MKKIVALTIMSIAVSVSVQGYAFQYSQDFSGVGQEIQDRYQQQQLVEQQQKIADEMRKMREQQERERNMNTMSNSFNN